MPGRSYEGPFKPLAAEELEIRDHLKRHVWTLAGTFGERNVWHYAQLAASADYVESVLKDEGYEVSPQTFRMSDKALEVKNLEAEIQGTALAGEIIVVGAHYDSVFGSPGANDNGTGTAAVLEIARLLKDRTLARTVRLVAFVNEEAPFFTTDVMGSAVYARRARQRGEKIVAMLSLETIGYYSDAEGSQHYPAPLNLFYPSTGNFIGFVGNISSLELVRRSIRAFRKATEFPSEGGAFPSMIPGVDWSDHWAFWQEGYSAIMVTDTALYRYAHYHGPDDTPDKIAYDRMARVVLGLAQVVVDLANM